LDSKHIGITSLTFLGSCDRWIPHTPFHVMVLWKQGSISDGSQDIQREKTTYLLNVTQWLT